MGNIRIKNIFLDDACCDKHGMNMALNVDLDNGSFFTVFLDSLVNEALFCDVVLNKCGKPETDGSHVYWSNGASLSLQDMMDILQTEKGMSDDSG